MYARPTTCLKFMSRLSSESMKGTFLLCYFHKRKNLGESCSVKSRRNIPVHQNFLLDQGISIANVKEYFSSNYQASLKVLNTEKRKCTT